MPRNIKLQITSRHIEQNMSQYLPRNTTPKKHWTMKRLVLQAQVKSLSTSVVRTTDCVCKFSYHRLLLSASTFRHPACNDSITRNVVTDRFFYDNTLEIRVMSNLRPMTFNDPGVSESRTITESRAVSCGVSGCPACGTVSFRR